MGKTSHSIRGLLIRWLLAPLLALLAVGALVDYYASLNPASAVYDETLLNLAHALSKNVKFIGERPILVWSPEAEKVLRSDKYDRVFYQILGPNNEFVAGNKGLPAAPDGGQDKSPPAGESGENTAEAPSGAVYYNDVFRGQPIRAVEISVPFNDSYIYVQVAETTIKRAKLTRDILHGLIFSEILFVATAFALMWLGIKRGLAPLEQLRAEIATRSHRDLSPIAEDPIPAEVRPVVEALNGFLRRLEESLGAQRRFLANAAHQLRTPLAGLQTQVEIAAQQTQPEEIKHSLRQIKTATHRTAHLVNQILTLARTEEGFYGGAGEFKPLDLGEVARAAAREWAPRAIAQKIDLGFKLEPAWIQGERFLLQELISNLIDNAIRYNRQGGQITVRSLTQEKEALLEVEDDGPGIPQSERETVFKRFYRGETSRGEGSGLGLSIVKEIMHAHGGNAEVLTPGCGQGTLIRLRFKAAAPAACTP